MAHEEQIKKCSTSNGSGDGGISIGHISRSSRKQKQKKVPQRGLGVAQLEKIRLEEQQKKDVSINWPFPAHISQTKPSNLSVPIPNYESCSSSIPHPPDLSSPNPMFRTQNIELINSNSTIPLANSVGRQSVSVQGQKNVPMWNSSYYKLEKENCGVNPGLTFRSSFNLPCESNIWPFPSLMQRAEHRQHSSSYSMVNASSGSSSSSLLDFQMEPPSNQSYFDNHTYNSPVWIQEEKMVGMKRSYPFSLDNPPCSSFHSIGDMYNLSFSNPNCREGSSSSTSILEPTSKKSIKEKGACNGGFLTLAPPATTLTSANFKLHPSTYQAFHNFEAFDFDSLPYQGNVEDQILQQAEPILPNQQQTYYCFLPRTLMQIGQPTKTINNCTGGELGNRLCLAAEVPLVESGTTGFLGQVTVHVKGKTECYECQPKPAPKTYPVCTITSTPSKFVHCIVWAKDLLFAKLFGDKNQENDLNVRSNDAGSSSEHTDDVFELRDDEDLEQYGRRIYDHVFGYNIVLALSDEETWKKGNKPRPIYSRDVLPDKMTQPNGNVDKTDDLSSASAMASLGLKNPQDIWCLMENTRVFLEALKLFFTNRKKEIGNLSFDKDDQLAVEFVTAAANIRAASFNIPLHSLFEAKGIAGNIVHAVATTNAIVAGLIVIEAIKVLKKDTDSYRMTYCLEHPSKKMLLMPVEPFEPNKSCCVCSQTPLSLEINTHRSKLRDFVEKIVKAKLGMNSPLIMHGSALLYEVGDDLEEDMIANYTANLEKVLSELPSPVTGGQMLTVEDLQQEFKCNIYIKHREEFDEEKEPDGMVLSGWTQDPPEKKDDKTYIGNGASTSKSLPTEPVDAQKDIEVKEISDGTASPGKKRKLPEFSEVCTLDQSSDADETRNHKKIQRLEDDYDSNNDNNDDDDLVMLDHWDNDTSKKQRLQ